MPLEQLPDGLQRRESSEEGDDEREDEGGAAAGAPTPRTVVRTAQDGYASFSLAAAAALAVPDLPAREDPWSGLDTHPQGRPYPRAMRREGWHERESFAGQDLRHATLDGRHYKMCDFSGADLRGASLRGASFAFCDLRGADLRGADLTGASFGRVLTHDPAGGRTDVTGARFDDATLRRTTFDAVIGWPAEQG